MSLSKVFYGTMSEKLKLQRLKIVQRGYLVNFFLEIYESNYEEKWDKTDPRQQNQREMFLKSVFGETILHYSLHDLDELQIIALIEAANQKEKLPKYRGVPEAMEQIRNLRALLAHGIVATEPDDRIWTAFEKTFAFLGVENAKDQIKQIRETKYRIAPLTEHVPRQHVPRQHVPCQHVPRQHVPRRTGSN